MMMMIVVVHSFRFDLDLQVPMMMYPFDETMLFQSRWFAYVQQGYFDHLIR
jgi:hypothetical protein